MQNAVIRNRFLAYKYLAFPDNDSSMASAQGLYTKIAQEQL